MNAGRGPPCVRSAVAEEGRAEQREPVRMVLTGHQFARTLAFAFSPAAAYEVFHQRTAPRRVLHDLREGGVELAPQF
jgi:hypothetical protein